MSINRAALFLLAVAGCHGSRIEYHQVEFPGFSLEVPTILSYDADRMAEYRAGRVEARDSLRLVILNWRLGAHMSVEEIPAMVRAMLAVAPESMAVQFEPARTLQISGHDATQIDARIETSQISYTEIACGKRAVTVVVFARVGGIQVMRDRILGSFDCHPIATLEPTSNAAAAPFGIDDPALLAGWHRMSDDDFMMSNGELFIHVSQRPAMPRVAAKLDQYLPTIAEAMGASWTSGRIETRRTRDGERAFHHGRMSTDGDPIDAIATAWNCPGRNDAVMAFAASESGGKLDPAVDLLAKLRCAKPDDPPLPLAPAPPEASGD